MGEGTEGNFRAASIFFLALPHFSYRGTFSGKPWHIFGRKKIETKILWRYSLGARVVPSPSTQIGELSFTTRKILPFYKSKERKSIELSLKCMGSKTISVPFELEKFSKALYGTAGGTYSARVFRPVMDM